MYINYFQFHVEMLRLLFANSALLEKKTLSEVKSIPFLHNTVHPHMVPLWSGIVSFARLSLPWQNPQRLDFPFIWL